MRRRIRVTAAAVAVTFMLSGLIQSATAAPESFDKGPYMVMSFDDGSSVTFYAKTREKRIKGPLDSAAARSVATDVVDFSAEPAPQSGGTATSKPPASSPVGSVSSSIKPWKKRFIKEPVISAVSYTPTGYKLFGTRAAGEYYLYKSTRLRTDLYSGNDVWQGTYEVWLDQNLRGDTTWRITAGSRRVSGSISYNHAYEYWCGINIPNARDLTCGSDDPSASPYRSESVDYVGWSHSPYFNASFGRLYDNRAKFPMLRNEISLWYGGWKLKAEAKFRGWDIRWNGNEWRLANASGTGY